MTNPTTRIRAINSDRYRRMMNREPGNPPNYICDLCEREDCRCCETCDTYHPGEPCVLEGGSNE